MKKKFIKSSIVVILLIFSSMSWAGEWKLDPNHSTIQFGIKHIFATVWGRFTEYKSEINFDPEKPDKNYFDFTVDIKSVNTFNAKRDTHLRSDDFFSADKFPTMHFSSSEIVHKDGENYIVKGEMTIKKTTKKMEIPFVYHGVKTDPFNPDQLVTGFDTRFTINRLEFGVGTGKFYEMGILSDTVNVEISIEALAPK